LVNADYLRFDFSHFAKMTDEEIEKVEQIVNEKILQNVALDERRNVPIADAEKLGATMLFGEKYGEFVRVITFDEKFSRELCGGTHVKSTGEIGMFKIVSESSTAAGVRRIEAITGKNALQWVKDLQEESKQIKVLLNNPKNTIKSIEQLITDNKTLNEKVEEIQNKQVVVLKNELLQKVQNINGQNVIAEIVSVEQGEQLKTLVYMLKNEVQNFVFILGANVGGKAAIHVMTDETLAKEKGYNAGNWIKENSKLINGGGGGQPFYASAGGTKPEGLNDMIEKLVTLIK
jgi:alanyl-tRNA synthetase